MSPWFLLAAMSMATFILTKLVVDLDFPPVLWLRDRVIGGWRPLTLSETDRLQRSIATPGSDLGWTWQEIDGERHLWVARTPWVPLFFAELMGCPWCVSAWMAAGVTTGVWAVAGLQVPVLYGLSTWALGALLAQHDYA